MHELKQKGSARFIRIALKEVAPMTLLAILVSSYAYADVLSKCAAAADWCTFDRIVGLVGRAQCFSTILGYLLAIFVFPSFLHCQVPNADLMISGFHHRPPYAAAAHGIWKQVATSSLCLSKALLVLGYMTSNSPL